MRRLTICMLLAALAVAGCGGDEEKASATATATATATAEGSSGGGGEASGGGGENLALAADPSALKFDKSELTAPAGKVTITLDNPADIPHNVVIDAPGAKPGDTVGKGQESVASADLKAGEYAYFCAVGNHRAAGMEGKLTVE